MQRLDNGLNVASKEVVVECMAGSRLGRPDPPTANSPSERLGVDTLVEGGVLVMTALEFLPPCIYRAAAAYGDVQ